MGLWVPSKKTHQLSEEPAVFRGGHTRMARLALQRILRRCYGRTHPRLCKWQGRARGLQPPDRKVLTRGGCSGSPPPWAFKGPGRAGGLPPPAITGRPRPPPPPRGLAGPLTPPWEVLLRCLPRRVSGRLSWSGLWAGHKVGVMTGNRILCQMPSLEPAHCRTIL